jgi:hypothetical protein
VSGLHPEPRGAQVSLQGQGKTTLRVLYRPAARGGARLKLTGRSSQGPLVFEALHVPGLWQTELAMQGPEQLQFIIEPATRG